MLALVVLLFPHFKQTYEVMNGWADQSFYMRIMDTVGRGDARTALDFEYMGPSYIAAIAVLKRLFGLDSIGAFVLLNRLCVALAIATPTALALSHDYRRNVLVAATFVAFVLSTPYLFMSSIPWSHFVYGLPAAIFLIAMSLKQTWRTAALAGVCLGVMATTRLFDTYVIAGLLIVAALIDVAIDRRIKWDLAAAFAGAFVAGYAAHFFVLGQFNIYQQYAGGMAHESAGESVIRLDDVPIKLVQMFIDPCFYSVCSEVDYQKAALFVVQDDPTLSNWRMPFALQVPFYVAAVVVGLLLLIRRPALVGRVFTDRAILIGLGSAIAIPMGYASYIMGGADQLKYGFSREIFTATVFLMVCILILTRRDYLTRREKNWLVGGVFAISIVGLQIMPWAYGFLRLESTHIASMDAVETCDKDACAVDVTYRDAAGGEITIPFDSLAFLQAQCANGGKTFISEIVDLDSYRYQKPQCADGYQIVTISTTTGVARLARDKGIGGTVPSAPQ
ncbi:hypothetical protein [Mesorhizobium sp. LjNodule214]|uniref:hypothetical protein n=1 Tax=Mesorhizobium sp. LjNodule214 TaxID=3342252 RepID=UPI003ECC1B86